MSQLYLKTANLNEKTIMSDSFFTAPLKIVTPFYHKTHTEVMIMCASAGMLDGDVYEMEFDISDDTNFMITNQSYTKLFRSENAGIRQMTKIKVGKKASFCYFPSPVIPFTGSCFHGKTDIHLEESAQFFLCEIFACGRVGMGEQFVFDEYVSRTAVYLAGEPVFIDNTRLFPGTFPLENIGFFEGYSHMGFFYIYGVNLESLPLHDSLEIGMSSAQAGVCIRVLGNSGEDIISYGQNLAKIFFL